MYSKPSFPNIYEKKLRRIISSVLIFNLGTFFYHTAKNAFRSNKFIWAYFFVHLLLSLIYLGYSFILSSIPVNISNFIWVSIAFSDIFLKHYMPGVFVEYVFPLLQISLYKKTVSFYMTLNIIFNYTNIVIFSTIFFENAEKYVFFIFTILILNHLIVLLFKINQSKILNNAAPIIVSLIALFNLISVLLIKNVFISISFSIIGLMIFINYINNSLYVK